VTDSLPHLDSDLEAVLRVERDRRGPARDTRERVLRRIRASVAAGGGLLGEGPRDEHEIDRDPAAASTGEAASIANTIWNALKRAHPGLVGGTGFLLGMAAGAGLHAYATGSAPRPPSEVTQSAALIAAAPSTAPPSQAPSSADRSPSPASASVAKPASSPPGAPPFARSAPSPDGQGKKLDRATLAGERALLDLAHAALGRGDTRTALDALTRHSQRFPRGMFREEREALRVQCLGDMGRIEEARRAAESFTAQYPKSLFRSKVDRATRSNR
jgi:hypothetical protein